MPYDSSLYIDPERASLSPWVPASSSSRVSQLRYDHFNRAIQVQWTNEKNNGYVYGECTYEQYRSFARAASRGKYINKALNSHPYKLMDEVGGATDTGEYWDKPSDPRYRGLSSRVTDRDTD